MFYLAIALAILSPEVLARSFTVKNNCQYTVWCVALCSHEGRPLILQHFWLGRPYSRILMSGPAYLRRKLGQTVFKFCDTTSLIFLRWEASAGQTVTFDVPDDWKSGRIWVSERVYQDDPLNNL